MNENYNKNLQVNSFVALRKSIHKGLRMCENIFSEEIFDTITLDISHILLNIEDLEEIEFSKKK